MLTIKSGELIAKTEELKEANTSLLASNGALKLKVKELNESNNAVLESDNNLALVIKELAESNEKFAVNKELALANEQIKQNGNMQIEFINIASHELRTPMQPILGFTQIIRSKIKDTEQIELLDAVIRNAKRLKQITDDIFDVTRIESRSLNLNKEQFDLNEQIKTAINDIKNQINMRYNNNAVKLSFETERKEGNGVFIKADKIRIYEVISNLLKNAIKFTKEAEPNKVWTKNAAVLIVVVARKNFEHNEKYSITHQFDAGAAWENLALEASSRGLAVHAMQGFDYERARADLQIPDNFDVMAMIAIGKQGPKDNLPPQLHEKEHPNDRKPLAEIVMEGQFKRT